AISLILFLQCVDAFVYSCDEVLFSLLNKGFTQYAKFAYVITINKFSYWDQLNHIYLQLNGKRYSFADIAVNHNSQGISNDDYESIPWEIVGEDPFQSTSNIIPNCDQEFTLILKSDENEIIRTDSMDFDADIYLQSAPFSSSTRTSALFVYPAVGMWIHKSSMRGDGNISVYTGAGIGEEEDRFLLQSWPY
ncbi:hypothetical protein PENTCL1PPCAC_20557, partial [Pristionchus entomophagus]